MPPSPSSSLRTVSHAVSTTPPDLLPQTTPYLLTILTNCGTILSTAESHTTGKEATDSSILVHKYSVQLSALLQGKSFQARWAGVVLIKATIELGGWEVLRNSGAWVRGLLGILAKPDPPTTHGLAVASLTKIYILTQPYQTLKREILTPTLPQFISLCLNLVKSRQPSSSFEEFSVSNPLLPSILDAFCILTPHHPTLFRPHLERIGLLISPLLAPTTSLVPSDDEEDTAAQTARTVAPQRSAIAQHLHVLLSHCAPKNTASEVWLKGFKTTVLEVHKTCDQIFRAAIEDWEPTVRHPLRRVDTSTFGNTVSDDGGRTMGLPGWTGIRAGIERLVGLLELLSKYVSTPTGATVSLPLGSTVDVLARIFSLTVPSSREKDNYQKGVRLNPQIGKEEREGLWAGLPQAHVAGMELLITLIERLGEAIFPMVQGLLDHINWVFNAEGWDVDIRTAIYTLLAKILGVAGISLPKSSVSSLSRIFKSCCCDLLPPQQQTSAASDPKIRNKKFSNFKQPSTNADSFLAPSASASSSPHAHNVHPGLRQAAHTLLPLILLNVPSQHLQLSLRSQVDRTAILTQHKGAMMASVLFPPGTAEGGKPRSSILPHLARSYPSDPEVEGLLRPRMPVVPTGKGLLDNVHEDDEEDEVMDDAYTREEPLGGDSANDMSNTGLIRSGIISGSSLSANDQDTHPSRPIPPSRQLEDPFPLPGTSKRFHDTADPHGDVPPYDLRETSGRHRPSSPKRLRVDSSMGDDRATTRNPEPAYSATASQSPTLTAPIRPIVESSELVPAPALQVPPVSAVAAQTRMDIESDGEFEVPELVMDADTDEAEEIGEVPDGGG
ncbi:MAG: hypothetical protein M1839_007686 [Geoglossum umbratile]|nr:MAG: hypothetical protein M1839_007686 [Geoglossum umbratile]